MINVVGLLGAHKKNRFNAVNVKNCQQMQIMAALLKREARNSVMRRFPFPSSLKSSPSLMYTLFSSTSSSSTSASNVVSGAAAADVADVDVEEDDLIYSESPAVSNVKLEDMPTLLQPRVVVYDGVCHLCHRGVKWVIKADKYRKIKFCCLQSKTAKPYMRLCGVDKEDVLRRFLFIEGPGSYHQGSTAALRVMSYLPLPYSALSILMIIPTPLREAVYDYVAKRRYDWFGKEEDCLVLQEKEMLERFIDREEMMDRDQSDS